MQIDPEKEYDERYTQNYSSNDNNENVKTKYSKVVARKR